MTLPHLLSILLALSLTLPAHAILDRDADGMSDVWESQFGFSPTSSTLPDQLPTADPDGDGVSNTLEAIADTNPLSATSSSGTFRTNPTPSQPNLLQWQAVPGKNYQVSTSATLTASSWSLLNQPITLSAGNLASVTTPSPTASRGFYRVSVNDLDTDSDTLTDTEELALGTNPNVADSDGDGIIDVVEINQSSNPSDPSDLGLPQPPPVLLPMKIKIYMGASLATDYEGGGENGLLTPYRVKLYRQNVSTGVETLVHTTPDYVGDIFSVIDTVELPNLSNDPTQRYTAQVDLPTIGTDIFSQPFRRWSFLVTLSASVGGAPFVGVNGFEPISQTFGTAGGILRGFKIFNPVYEDYRAVIEPIQVSWKAILGYDNVAAHIDPWNKPIAGAKIFPDYKNPLDNVVRAKLQVVVKTSAALAGKTIFVKAFDVDDSTSETFDTTDGAPVVDPNGKAGNDNFPDYLNTPQSGQFWTGTAWGTNTAQGIVDSNGQTTFDFRVGMQPGSNYRIVASAVDQSMITDVQVTSATAAAYLGPELAQTGGAPASPLLTVWRRLWVENDSMASIPVDTLGFKRNDLTADLVSPAIQQVFPSTDLTTLYIPTISDRTSFNELQNGILKLPQIGLSFPVLNTITNLSPGVDAIQLTGNQSNIPPNSLFRLYDDDGFGLLGPPLPRIDLVDERIKGVYRPAFIEVMSGDLWNDNKTVDFYRNYPPVILSIPNGYNYGVLDDALDAKLEGNENLWCASVVVAYQPGVADGDPNDEDYDVLTGATIGDSLEIGGVTIGFLGRSRISIVYSEVIRDQIDDLLRIGVAPTQEYEQRLRLTAAHEIGHQPLYGIGEATQHAEEGLMTDGGHGGLGTADTPFTAKSIRRFRSVNRWRQKNQ